MKKLACIDIGNTNIVIGLYNKNNLIKTYRIETNKLELNKINFSEFENIAISSVVPKITQNLEKYNPFIINHENSQINLKIDNPKEVGNDRLANIKATIKEYKLPAIIIDFGSATTYDIINKNKEFIGGAIAPGIDVSAKYLFEKAALLNQVSFEFPENVIGKSTTTNLQSGIMFGGIDSINGMINRIQCEFDETIETLILTGGFSKILSPKINHPHTLDPELTIKGIQAIWNDN